MTVEANILKAVRTELGDLVEPFRDSFRGDGEQVNWDISARNLIEDSVLVIEIDTVADPRVTTTLVPDTDYLLDAYQGEITFVVAPPEDRLVWITGNAYGIFTDDELTSFLDAAIGQHLLNRTVERRYRDGHGFIKYERVPMELADLPATENILLVLLTAIEALWALSTDASMDIDVQTAEGTSIPRTQRYRQIVAQIDLLEQRYLKVSLAMGVGLYAPEVLELTRRSKTTGRLVPSFQEREYDENGPPIRKKLRINTRDSDPDGPYSPWWVGGWGY